VTKCENNAGKVAGIRQKLDGTLLLKEMTEGKGSYEGKRNYRCAPPLREVLMNRISFESY